MAAKAKGTDGHLSAHLLLQKRLRAALVKARELRGLSQRAVGKELDWSTSKVVRIEQGTVPVAPTDVRAMLGVYGVEDAERVDELVEMARQARTKEWKDYEKRLSQPLQSLIASESAARSIWKYEPSVVPGYFQTATYAQILLNALGQSPEYVTMMAEVRLNRRLILDPSTPLPEIHVVIGEASLLRPVGGPKVMREQLRDLIELDERESINLYALPLSSGPHRAMGQAFTVLQFGDDEFDDALYLEDGNLRVNAEDKPEEIFRFLRIYNEIQQMAEETGPFKDHADRITETLYPI